MYTRAKHNIFNMKWIKFHISNFWISALRAKPYDFRKKCIKFLRKIFRICTLFPTFKENFCTHFINSLGKKKVFAHFCIFLHIFAHMKTAVKSANTFLTEILRKKKSAPRKNVCKNVHIVAWMLFCIFLKWQIWNFWLFVKSGKQNLTICT